MTVNYLLAALAAGWGVLYLPGAVREWRDSPSARDVRSMEKYQARKVLR